MSRRPSIADAMREVGGGTRAQAREEAQLDPTAGAASQPGRAATKAITGHFAPEVRVQLKVLGRGAGPDDGGHDRGSSQYVVCGPQQAGNRGERSTGGQ